MTSNPFLGVGFHWLGGLASASFYVYFRRVKRWSWETYWLAAGFFSWLIMPWFFALLLTRDLFGVLAHAPFHVLALSWCFGAMWGLGGLTAGLTLRYLGLSLGQGVTLGLCAAFGTLVPPLFKGELGAIAASASGRITLLGVGICLIGIVFSALAGLSKEREMPETEKKASVKEFNFGKGMVLAVFAGIMSSFFAFGLDSAAPLADLSAAAGTAPLWTGLPKIAVVLLGGFTTNLIACVTLNLRNRSGHEWVRLAPTEESFPLSNYLICAAAGITWYLQFFFYSMGETQMGRFKFSSWTLHMASIIIFSTGWGWILMEWRGSSRRTHCLIGIGMAVLALSTLVVGYGNYLNLGPAP